MRRLLLAATFVVSGYAVRAQNVSVPVGGMMISSTFANFPSLLAYAGSIGPMLGANNSNFSLMLSGVTSNGIVLGNRTSFNWTSPQPVGVTVVGYYAAAIGVTPDGYLVVQVSVTLGNTTRTSTYLTSTPVAKGLTGFAQWAAAQGGASSSGGSGGSSSGSSSGSSGGGSGSAGGSSGSKGGTTSGSVVIYVNVPEGTIFIGDPSNPGYGSYYSAGSGGFIRYGAAPPQKPN